MAPPQRWRTIATTIAGRYPGTRNPTGGMTLSSDILESQGQPFAIVEAALGDALDGAGPYLAVFQEPPWAALATRVPTLARVISAGSMEREHLDRLTGDDETRLVVGIGVRVQAASWP